MRLYKSLQVNIFQINNFFVKKTPTKKNDIFL